jgi:hypothetical protein
MGHAPLGAQNGLNFGQRWEKVNEMLQDLQPKKRYQDDWDTGSREGYEDRGAFRVARTRQTRDGSVLRTVGGLAIVGGIGWGVYLVTQGGDVVEALRQNHGPAAIMGIGVISYLLGKYLRV